MKQRRTSTWMGIALLYAFMLPAAAPAEDEGLISTLTKSLGVTETQATGGTRAIFQVAKQSLSSEDYGKVAAALPIVKQLLDKEDSASAGSAGATLGAISSLTGSDTAGVASLAATFSDLDMDAGMVEKFMPIIYSYAEKKGGPAVSALLKGALEK